MRPFVLLASMLFVAVAPAQDWVRHRGPGELLSPQLGGVVNGIPADLTVWEFAWQFQRDALAPPRRVGEPLAAEVHEAAIAALRASCQDSDAELAMLGHWGLARIGRQHEGAAQAVRAAVLAGSLARPAPVGEVAALALGLAAGGDKAAVAALRDLANDTDAGRKLAGQPAVPERLRCFALYGLGLAAENGREAELQFRVLAAVERLLLPAAATPTQVRIAALHALLLLQLDAAPKLPGPALALLDQQWALVEGPQPLSVRAQVPLAAAAMLRPGDAAAEAWRDRLAKALQTEGESNAVCRSCAQALGRLCRPCATAESPDAQYSELLRALGNPVKGQEVYAARDQQTRNLAFFALGTIGGASNEAWLSAGLGAKGVSFLYRPWIALGLGAGFAARGEAGPAEVVAALEQAVQTPNPGVFGAMAAGLGLCRAQSTAPLLRNLLRRHAAKADMAAPFCTALGAFGDAEALPLLTELASTGLTAQLRAEAMAAMAELGGAGETTLRALLLDAAVASGRRHAAAAALRGRADSDAVAALARTLRDANATVEARRFAAFALGSLCDRSARHWSAKLASSIDYRGVTPVLVGLPDGVLRLP